MGFKVRPKRNRFFAARFYDHDGPRSDYNIALYTSIIESEATPHDYIFFFSRKEWRRIGGSTPPKDGYSIVELKATELGTMK